ncbi:MAG TPA: glycoside hydrolase family 92 protein, partial [Flavisolibacter sp.]|nr:glycoside hydrolase family 92 protein [Flavisolibacter sp.]
LKMALSAVSTESALLNLRTETPGWDFNQVKAAGQAAWEKELSKVTIETKSTAAKENFYTAMYHAFISPTLYMDVDGSYRGLDQNIYKANGFANYTTFSLWDTYRALHPLLNIVQPKRNAHMVQSMLAHYNQSSLQMLPVWSNSANENWCMTGYHSVSVVADAIVKGNTPFDANKALDACMATANHRGYDGLSYYLDRGYVPEDRSGSSVSQTLEYAYDDWCIAQAAKKLNREDVYKTYSQRAENYKKVFDAATGFMRPRLNDGSFRPQFDPMSTHGQGFIEGNAWNYSLFVPHDPATMIALMGGKKQFTKHLDSLFTMELPDKYFAGTEDITRDGIIGNYVHGNEPSHHVAYLYNWTDEPWKAGARIRQILPMQYKNTPDGLGGNDDCGQMSAWYIFSSLGFYPVAPASDQYWFGSPAVDAATLPLENGKTFTMQAINQSDKNVYVQKVVLNGEVLNRRYITHNEIMNGAKLTFVMGPKPDKKMFQ